MKYQSLQAIDTFATSGLNGFDTDTAAKAYLVGMLSGTDRENHGTGKVAVLALLFGRSHWFVIGML